MNDFSFFLIALSGFLLGLVFPDLLAELKLKKEHAFNPLIPIILPFVSLVGFLIYPFIFIGQFTLVPMEQFYNSIFFWMTIALLVGGYLRIFPRIIKQSVASEKTHPHEQKAEKP